MPNGGRNRDMSGKKIFNLRTEGHYAFSRRTKAIPTNIIPDEGWISNWLPPKFFIPEKDGIIPDYMSSNVEGRFCSSKLKNIIEKNKAKNA